MKVQLSDFLCSEFFWRSSVLSAFREFSISSFGRVIGGSIELLVWESSHECCCGCSFSKKLYNADAEIEDVSVLFKCCFVRDWLPL